MKEQRVDTPTTHPSHSPLKEGSGKEREVLKLVPALYLNRRVNGQVFTVTEDVLVAAAKEFTPEEVARFFSDGAVAVHEVHHTKTGALLSRRTLVDAMREAAENVKP